MFSDSGVSAVSQRAGLSRAETSDIVLIAAEGLASGSEEITRERKRESMGQILNRCTLHLHW